MPSENHHPIERMLDGWFKQRLEKPEEISLGRPAKRTVHSYRGQFMNSHIPREARTIVAFHEAGHAVMAWICGAPIKAISIVPDAASQGRVTFHDTSIDHPWYDIHGYDQIQREVLISLAGVGADYQHAVKNNADPAIDFSGHHDDQRQARELLHSIGRASDIEFEIYLSDAATLLGGAETWLAVEAVADQVLHSFEIEGKALHDLMVCAKPLPHSHGVKLDRLCDYAKDQGIPAILPNGIVGL